MPTEGDLRVWNIINVPGPATYHPVQHVEEAVGLINRLRVGARILTGVPDAR